MLEIIFKGFAVLSLISLAIMIGGAIKVFLMQIFKSKK